MCNRRFKAENTLQTELGRLDFRVDSFGNTASLAGIRINYIFLAGRCRDEPRHAPESRWCVNFAQTHHSRDRGMSDVRRNHR